MIWGVSIAEAQARSAQAKLPRAARSNGAGSSNRVAVAASCLSSPSSLQRSSASFRALRGFGQLSRSLGVLGPRGRVCWHWRACPFHRRRSASSRRGRGVERPWSDDRDHPADRGGADGRTGDCRRLPERFRAVFDRTVPAIGFVPMARTAKAQKCRSRSPSS